MQEYIDNFTKNYKENEFLQLRCIYGLYHGKELVYIGSTTNFAQRISTHMSTDDKIFDGYCYTEVMGDTELESVEATLIAKYQPRYNRGLPINKLYVSYPNSKKKYGFRFNHELDSFINEHQLKPCFLIRGLPYFYQSDFAKALGLDQQPIVD